MNRPTVGETDDLTVHRCVVTVIRRGGWSWGPDPQGLVRRILDTLPDLLTERFAERLAGDGPEVEITEPVTVTVRLGPGRWPGGDPVSPGDVVIEPAEVASALAASPGVPEVDAVSPEEYWEGRLAESARAAIEADGWSAPTVADLFGELAERGELEPLLVSLPDEVLRTYLAALLDVVEESDHAPSSVAGLLVAELDKRVEPVRLSTVDAPDPVETGEPPSVAQESPNVSSGVDGVRAVDEVEVWSALPFLLAGPLARIGYLDAIGGALSGLEMAGEAPSFATALAYKVLGVTERGWRRAERDTVAAAAFAGLATPVPSEDLAGFARRVGPALPVLDGILALSLCRGHEPGEPLLVTAVGDRLLLVDAQGVFPIAWADGVAGFLPHWHACGRPPVLVCDSPLPPGCLWELAEAGVRLVTDVRPLRGDPLTRLSWRSPLWTSSGADTDLRLAAELPGHAGRLADLVCALVTERRAVPLAEDGGLERSVTLAAALGLGTMAWLLWRDKEVTDPVLALDRFADLDAVVRFERDAVRVRVPLGRRHADLLRAGLLSDVRGVGWLGGRTLTFSGG